MGRTENVAVFEDTEKCCKNNKRLKESIQKSTEEQRLYPECEELPGINKDKYKEPANVCVTKNRTLEAAKAYRGTKTAVRNFASASNPGGGVQKGASAQEECLCRCTGLFFNLNTADMWAGFYGPHRASHDPLHNDDVIYTPGVIVFKTDTDVPGQMPERNWYPVDVITCAAPNLRNNPSNSYNTGDGQKSIRISMEGLQTLHEKRLRRILDIAVLQGAETIILGAFGCGAFQNDPQVVAAAAKNVIAEYEHAFQNIEFAVYCSPRDTRNYEIFHKVLGK